MKKNFIYAICLCGVLLCGCTNTSQTNATVTGGTTETTTPVADTSVEMTTTAMADLTGRGITGVDDADGVDESFVEETGNVSVVEVTTDNTEVQSPRPPAIAEEFEYGGRSNVFSTSDYVAELENVLWMTKTNTYVSTDDCELLFFESKEDATTEQIAYVGTSSAGDHTVLGLYQKYDDSFADDPMVGENYWAYKEHILAVSGDKALQYFPAGTSVPTNIVLFPDCGDFYYYGSATEEEYENNEYHWTKSADLGLTWKPDSESSTIGNFYYGEKPVFYEYGVWDCGSESIWIK